MKNSMRLLLIGLLFSYSAIVITYRSAQSDVSAQAKNEVTIANNKFEPKRLSVTEGDIVTWKNTEGVHTVKSDTDVFVSKTLKANDTFSYQFTKAGTYPYHCTFHGDKGGNAMAGTIVVAKKK